MKKRLMALCLCGLMVFSLAGCGSSSSGNASSGDGAAASTTAAAGSDSSSGYSTDKITINIWDSNQQEGLQKIADDWTATSGVKVNIEVIDWDNYWTLLEAGASGGEMPDVFWMHSNTAQMYMENNIR